MENDILDSLNDLGYQGPLTEEVAFAKALDGGAKSLEFTKLVHILAEELKTLCSLEETVNIINDVDESSSFLLELSSFLKELGCPYKCLVTGHMSSRLQSKVDRLLLLDYLVSELMAARMVQVDCPKEKQGSGMEIVMQESPTAKDLKDILISLKFNKPPPNITLELLFSKMEAKLKDTIQKEGDKLVGKPLYNKALTDKDWKNLDTAYSDMYEEYRLRRETLITRLECTIQSFEWSDRLKSKKDTIQSVYRPCRNALTVKPAVKISDFLAARTTLLHVEKTSSASVRKNTQSDVNKVIIGRVPDRGGRPNEQQPPPPEMPSWQQRSAPQVKSRENDYSNYGPNLSWYFNEMMSNTDNDESTKQSNQTINISTQTKKSTQSNQSFDRNTPRENNTPPNKSLDTSTARKKRTHFNKRFDTSTPNEKSYQSKQSFATRTITEKTTPPNKTFDTFSRDKSTQPNQGFDKSTPSNQGSHKSATRDKYTPSNQGFDKSTASVKSSSPNQSFETSTSHTQSKQSFDINREKTTSSNKMFDPTIPREKSTPSNQVFDKSTSGEKSSQSNQSVNTPNEKSAVQSISLGTSRDNTTQSNKSDPKEISIENSDDSSNDVMILEDIKVILIEDSPSEEISPQNSQTHEEITNNSPKRPNLKRKASQEDDSKPKIPKLSEERPKYEAYGQHIAERLRNMDQTLAVYCQKIINDAVFMAETNVLNCNSRIVNGGLFDNSSANEMIDVTSTQI